MAKRHENEKVHRELIYGKLFCKPASEILNGGITFIAGGDGDAKFLRSDLYVVFRVYDELKNITPFIAPGTDEGATFSFQLRIGDNIGLLSPNLVTNDFNPDKQTGYSIMFNCPEDGLYITIIPKLAKELVDKTIVYAFLRGQLG